MATNKKPYVPATIRILTLLGFAFLCLGFIVALEVMIQLGRGHIQDRGLQGIFKREVEDAVFPYTIGGLPVPRIRRQNEPATAIPDTTSSLPHLGHVWKGLLGDGPNIGIPTPTINRGSPNQGAWNNRGQGPAIGIPTSTINGGGPNQGGTSFVAPGLQGDGPETGTLTPTPIDTMNGGDANLQTTTVVSTLHNDGPGIGIPTTTTDAGGITPTNDGGITTTDAGGITTTDAGGITITDAAGDPTTVGGVVTTDSAGVAITIRGAITTVGGVITTDAAGVTTTVDGVITTVGGVITSDAGAITTTNANSDVIMLSPIDSGPFTGPPTTITTPNDVHGDSTTEIPVIVIANGGTDIPGVGRVTVYTTTKRYAVHHAPYGTALPTATRRHSAAPKAGMYRDAPSKQASLTPRSVRRLLFFVAQYLSTLIAVLLAIMWRIIDTDFKRMQPYYELSHSRGLDRSASSLCENYSFDNAAVVPFVAGYRGQWAVCISATIVGPVFTVVQILASTVLIMTVERPDKCNGVTGVGNCGRSYLATRDVLARGLQGVLVLVMAFVLFLVFLQSRRKSMLHSEPWSIAGLACLIADWSLLPDVFGSIEACDSGKELRKQVVGTDGVYRLVENTYPRHHLGIEMLPGKPWHHDDGILTMVLIYRFSHIMDYEKFMSGQGARVRLFMISVGIIIRSLWEPTEKEVRYLEVFRKLSRRHQSPETTILVDYTASIFLVTEVRALLRGDLYMAFIGFVGVLIEALVVVLPGIPFEPSQTEQGYEVATWLSVSVLILVLFAVVLVFSRRRSACMPRLPYSIATVMVYLYAARMLKDFVGLSVLDRKERDEKIVGLGKTYGFGWTTGEDGKVRVGVDVEELDYAYKYPS
ncbi:hypothetical protein K440DRAFT_678850 [Wilcoxina mikolae CBS 423.85]|nr:hypothetical protein K440DRAFT_678850 [Wilcoxina mikolae CBS 423.85]